MAATANVTKSISINGRTLSKAAEETGDSGIIVEPTGGVVAAITGTLTTRTDNDTGVVTAAAGHGFVTSDKLDVYWTTGGGGARYGMTATVAGNAVTVDGGTGDNLPTQGDAVTIRKPQVEDFRVNGANITGLYAQSTPKGKIRFLDEADAEVYAPTFAANGKDAWVNGDGVTNPLAAETTVMKVTFSHGETTAQSMLAAVIYD